MGKTQKKRYIIVNPDAQIPRDKLIEFHRQLYLIALKNRNTPNN